MDFGLPCVAALTAICFLITQGAKSFDIPGRWLPVIAGFTGGALGVPAMFSIPDFPATDPITAVAVGIVSGLAATGVHQAVKQFTKKED